MTIPVFSFITIFSSAFFNRQKQISYVANTALFNKEFTVDLYQLARLIYDVSKNRKKRFKICFIAPDSEI
jgi:predicted nucleic-acid-binding protein